MSNVEIAVGLGGEPGVDPPSPPVGFHILVDNIADEVATFSLLGSFGFLGAHVCHPVLSRIPGDFL